MATYINGVRYEGHSISVSNGVVTVDGKIVNATPESGILRVKIEGGVHDVSSDVSVECDDVSGDVRAGGSVQADDVGGNINAGGSVQCDNVGGSINAGGSVRHA